MHAVPFYEAKPTSIVCPGRDFILEANGKLYSFVFDLAITGHASITVGHGGAGPRAVKGLDRPIQRALDGHP